LNIILALLTAVVVEQEWLIYNRRSSSVLMARKETEIASLSLDGEMPTAVNLRYEMDLAQLYSEWFYEFNVCLKQ